jgi:hypothetical protein
MMKGAFLDALEFQILESAMPQRKYMKKWAILSRKGMLRGGVGILGIEVRTRITSDMRITGIHALRFMVR